VIVILALIPVVPVILPLIIFGGAGAVGFFVPMLTLLQTSVANEDQGRIFGAPGAIQAIALLVGMGMSSGLGDRIGIVPMLLIDAGFNILASLLAFALIRVPLQPVQPSTEINPVTSEMLEPLPESL